MPILPADTVGRFATGAKADHLALIHEHPDQTVEKYTFAELNELASRFSVFLIDLGVKPGQPVAIQTAQSPQTAIAHMAIYKIGAVAPHPVPSLRSGCRRAHHERLRCGSHHHQLGVLGCAAGTSERTSNPKTPNRGRSHRTRAK